MTTTTTKILVDLIREIPDGTLLAIGDCNHDFTLTVSTYERFNGIRSLGMHTSRGVRAISKDGNPAGNSGFGSLLYWSNYCRSKPHEVELTEAGKLIVSAGWRELGEVGGDWGITRY